MAAARARRLSRTVIVRSGCEFSWRIGSECSISFNSTAGAIRVTIRQAPADTVVPKVEPRRARTASAVGAGCAARVEPRSRSRRRSGLLHAHERQRGNDSGDQHLLFHMDAHRRTLGEWGVNSRAPANGWLTFDTPTSLQALRHRTAAFSECQQLIQRFLMNTMIWFLKTL
jgi:hypothetical protein